jgi:hypothetical protein
MGSKRKCTVTSGNNQVEWTELGDREIIVRRRWRDAREAIQRNAAGWISVSV